MDISFCRLKLTLIAALLVDFEQSNKFQIVRVAIHARVQVGMKDKRFMWMSAFPSLYITT